MPRLATVLLMLAVVVGGLMAGGQAAMTAAAQTGAPESEHEVVGSWLIYETNPPAGGEPVLAGVATFFADGNVTLIFGDQHYLGSWLADAPYEATFTVVAPTAGGFGSIDRLRGALEVATDGGPFRGIYTFDNMTAEGDSTFTYRGPIEGRRVEVQAPEPYP